MTQFNISTSLATSSDAETAENISQHLDQLVKSICRVQAENLDLERLLGECLIYKQQYQNDIEALKSIQKQLKYQMNKKVTKPVIYNTVVTPPQPPIPPQPTIPQPHTTNVDQNVVAHDSPKWSVEADNPMIKNGLTLKYALTTHSVLCTVQFNADGSLFAFADGKTLFIINAADGSLIGSGEIPVQSENTSDSHTRALAFSPDNKYIAIAGPTHEIIIYTVPNGARVHTLEEHTNLVSSLVFSSDSKRLYSGGFDGAICVWDTEKFKILHKRPPSPSSPKQGDNIVIGLALSHEESFIAVGFMNGTVGIFDTNFQEDMNTITAHPEGLLGITISNDDCMLATASQDKTAKIWSLKGFTKLSKTLVGHSELVLTVCFSLDGRLVLTGSKDEHLKGWDSKTGECLFTISAHANTLFKVVHHPTERKFISCSGEGLVCLWEYTFQ